VRVPLTVVTPTIPERRELLHELGQSIARQTAHPYEWIVRTDWDQVGPAVMVNRMVAEADTEWVFRCDDDDLYDTNHFEVIGQHLSDDYDVVYSWPRIDPLGHFDTPDALQMILPWKTLRDANWIASAAAIRTSLWEELGGYRDVHNEDHDFWVRALDAGARFRCIPQVTWTYRMGEWEHRTHREDLNA
jgi:hypothetical protein